MTITDCRVATANAAHTQEQLAEYFRYDPETGKLFWKINKNKARAGDEACTPHQSGYLAVQLDKTAYLVHLVIWCLVYGAFPESLIDHWDLNKRNNRLDNLRLSTGSGNCCNNPMRKDNKSGVKGVNWHTRLLKWQARVQINYKRSTNYFDSLEEAEAFVKTKRESLHQKFTNHGEQV